MTYKCCNVPIYTTVKHIINDALGPHRVYVASCNICGTIIEKIVSDDEFFELSLSSYCVDTYIRTMLKEEFVNKNIKRFVTIA